MHVLAPWYTTDPGSIQHAEAIVVTEQQGMFTNYVTGDLNSRQRVEIHNVASVYFYSINNKEDYKK